MDPNYYYRMNVAAVKKNDPTMISILDSATHVALYSFNSKDNKWEKTEIEGAMFLYSRTAVPQHAFIIMNRLSTENLIEPVNAGLDFQIKEPFLLYKTQQSLIFGIWFYDKNECYRVTSNLQKLVKSLQTKSDDQKEKRKDGVGGVDIFSMLSRAQEDFNTRNKPEKADGNKNPAEMGPPQSSSTAQALPIPIPQTSTAGSSQHTPQSVMDFFAKASNTQFPPQEHEKVMKPPPSILPAFFQHPPPPQHMINPPVMPAGLPSPPQRAEDNMKPILMRIMSNPVHSVEHIEKQQRSVTPDNKAGQPAGSLENGMKFLRMSPVAPNALFGTPPTSSQAGDRPVSTPLGPDIPMGQQPALIPPGMFSTPSRPELDTGEQTSGWMLGMSPPGLIPVMPLSTAKPQVTKLAPLTRDQLLQAITYLIRHDPEFINKLHEAYVKSFNELLS